MILTAIIILSSLAYLLWKMQFAVDVDEFERPIKAIKRVG